MTEDEKFVPQINFEEDDMKIVNETRDPETGDYIYTVEMNIDTYNILAKKYGKEDFEEDFSRDFNEWTRELIEKEKNC